MKPIFEHQTQHIERQRINPFSKLYFILEKNLKILIRTKTSALIFILGPLIITALLAIAFNTSTLSDVNVAIYSESYSPLTESLIANLTAENYNLIKTTSEPDCIDSARFSELQVCIIFPENMSITNDAENIISIYVDNSRLNIANTIASQITTKVSLESSSLSEDMVNEILIVLDTTNSESIKTKAIINELISQNSALKTSIDDASDSLNSIDFSFTPVTNLSLNATLSSLESSCNSSSSTISSLLRQVTLLQSSYTELTSKLSNTEESVATISETLPTISSGLSTQTSNLNVAQAHLISITDNVATIQITNADNIVTPMRTKIESSSTTNSFLIFILPTMLTIIIMFLALLLSSSSIISEKESKAYFRNFITPTNEFLFMLGEFLSNVLILSAQIVIMLGVLYFFLKDLIMPESFMLAGLGLLSIGILFTLFGMLIGYIFNTKQTVTITAITSGMVLLFFSNTIIPLETLSSKIRDILYYNPFIIGESMLKKIFLFNSTFAGIDQFLLIIGIISIVLLVFGIIARSISKNYFSP